MRIRPERPEDFDAVHAMVAAAFEREDEARLVRLIRGSDHYVPELTLVSEDDGEILGHVMLSFVHFDGGGADRVLCLAPLAVRPDRQRQGIGDALTRAALEAADARSEPLVVLTGHPSYYPRFGFEPARALGVESPEPGLTDEVWVAKRLGSYDPGLRGLVRYPPAFDAVDPN